MCLCGLNIVDWETDLAMLQCSHNYLGVIFSRFMPFSLATFFRIIVLLTSCRWSLTFAFVDDILLFAVTQAQCLGITTLFFYACLSIRCIQGYHLLLDNNKKMKEVLAQIYPDPRPTGSFIDNQWKLKIHN